MLIGMLTKNSEISVYRLEGKTYVNISLDYVIMVALQMKSYGTP